MPIWWAICTSGVLSVVYQSSQDKKLDVIFDPACWFRHISRTERRFTRTDEFISGEHPPLTRAVVIWRHVQRHAADMMCVFETQPTLAERPSGRKAAIKGMNYAPPAFTKGNRCKRYPDPVAVKGGI
jgi:hypothetical protein